MIDELVNPATRSTLLSYLSMPTMPLLIAGPNGSGKSELAKTVAAELLNLDKTRLAVSPRYTALDGAEAGDGIDTVRKVIRQLNLKESGGHKGVQRVIAILRADLLSAEAQAALLKTLEQPPHGCVIILTAESESAVLPTIVSRCRIATAYPVNMPETLAYMKERYNTSDIKVAWNLADGRAGLIGELLNAGSNHPLKAAVADAKNLLSMDIYSRILHLERNVSSKKELGLLVDGLSKVLHSAHRLALESGRPDEKILNNRVLVLKASKQLAANANPKMVGVSLALNLRG